ncbi:MAG: twitching motility protein PilT [Methanobacteriota archaeon]
MPFVVADVNGLMMPFQFKFNLDSELTRLLGSYTILVPESVVGELVNLSKRIPEARAALGLARRCECITVVASNPDEALITLARDRKAYVLTNDVGLITLLKKARIPIVRMKGRNHLVIVGDVS